MADITNVHGGIKSRVDDNPLAAGATSVTVQNEFTGLDVGVPGYLTIGDPQNALPGSNGELPTSEFLRYESFTRNSGTSTFGGLTRGVGNSTAQEWPQGTVIGVSIPGKLLQRLPNQKEPFRFLDDVKAVFGTDTDYSVQYNSAEDQLEIYDEGSSSMIVTVEQDGTINVQGNPLNNLFSLSGEGTGYDLYVSPSGDDSNDGESTGSPLASVQAAIDKINPIYGKEVTLHLASGSFSSAGNIIKYKKPLGDLGITLKGYINSTSGQFNNEARLSSTATGGSQGDYPNTLSSLDDTNINVSGAVEGDLLHITGGTGYSSNHDELNWYLVKSATSDTINIHGTWDSSAPSTDTTYEILDSTNMTTISNSSANESILYIQDSDNISCRFVEFSGGNGKPIIWSSKSGYDVPGAYRWSKAGVDYHDDIYDRMWLGVRVTNPGGNDGILLDRSDLELRASILDGSLGGNAAINPAYHSSLVFDHSMSLNWVFNLYWGTFGVGSIKDSYVYNASSAGIYTEQGWIDEAENVHIDGNNNAAVGVKVRQEGRIWLQKHIIVENNTSDGVNVANGGRGSIGNYTTIQGNGQDGITVTTNGGVAIADTEIYIQNNGRIGVQASNEGVVEGSGHPSYSNNTMADQYADTGGILVGRGYTSIKAYRSADWPMPSNNSWEKLPLNETSTDNLSEFNKTDNKFTCTEKGAYAIKFQVNFTNNIHDEESYKIGLYLNGNGEEYGQIVTSGTSPPIVIINTVLELSADDYLEFYVRDEGSAKSDVVSSSTWTFAKINYI